MMLCIIHHVILRPLKVLRILHMVEDLSGSLVSHPQFCLMCRYVSFRGCVSYGVCITVSCQQVSISIALNEVTDTNYRHCVVFCKLPSREVLYPKVSVLEVDCLSDMVLLLREDSRPKLLIRHG